MANSKVYKKTIRFKEDTMIQLEKLEKLLEKDPTFIDVGMSNFSEMVNKLVKDYAGLLVLLSSRGRNGKSYSEITNEMKTLFQRQNKKVESEVEAIKQIVTMLLYLDMDTNEISRLPNRQGTLEKMGTFADPKSPAGKKYKVLLNLLSKNKF